MDIGKVGDWERWELVALKGCGISVLGIFLTCLHTDLSNLVRIQYFSCFKKNVGLRSYTEVPSDLKDSKKTDLYWFGISRGRCWIFFLHSCVLCCIFSLPIMKKLKQNTVIKTCAIASKFCFIYLSFGKSFGCGGFLPPLAGWFRQRKILVLCQISMVYKSHMCTGISKCRLGTKQALKEQDKTMNTKVRIW